MSHRTTRTMKDIWRTSVKVGCAFAIVGSFAGLFTIGCESGGVGDPCTPEDEYKENFSCLLYTSPSPRDLSTSRMPSSA